MASQGFEGPNQLTLDPKGRLSIPTRYRESLAALAQNRVVVIKSPEKCLRILPYPAWEKFKAVIEALPERDADWRRFYLSFACECELDSGGRLLIDPVLRRYAGLGREVYLLGTGPYFELWDVERHDAREQTLDPASRPPEVGAIQW